MKLKSRTQAKQKFSCNVKSTYNKKLGVGHVFDSNLETDYYKKMKFEGVDFMIGQPSPLIYLLDNKRTRYTPDFEIIENGLRFFDEVKYAKETKKQDFQDKKEFLEREYQKQGAQFRVITENDVYDRNNIINISLLLPCLHHPAPHYEFQAICEGLDDRPYTLVEMNNIAIQRNIAPHFVKRAVAHKLFTVDIAQPYQTWQLIINEQTCRGNDE